MPDHEQNFSGPVMDINPANLPAEMTQNQAVAIQRITAGNVAEMIANAEALVEFNKKVTELAIKSTSMNDWVLLGDKPYLCDYGVDKVLQLIGASVVDINIIEEHVTTPDGTRSIHYTANGKILFNGREASNIGMSSTKDAFFADRSRYINDPDNPGQKKKVKYKLPLEEIDLPSVKKKCVTNLKHRLLNMAVRVAPSKEELEQAFGKKFDGTKVSYGKGSQGGSLDNNKDANHRTELKNLITQIAHYENKDFKTVLMELTAFGDFKGYYTLDRVSAKSLNVAIGNARKRAEALGGNQGNANHNDQTPPPRNEDVPFDSHGNANGGFGSGGGF